VFALSFATAAGSAHGQSTGSSAAVGRSAPGCYRFDGYYVWWTRSVSGTKVADGDSSRGIRLTAFTFNPGLGIRAYRVAPVASDSATGNGSPSEYYWRPVGLDSLVVSLRERGGGFELRMKSNGDSLMGTVRMHSDLGVSLPDHVKAVRVPCAVAT
jgi:hypothetical protein